MVFSQDSPDKQDKYSIGNSIENAIGIWQGFDFSWSYNHRLNRLGNGILQERSGSNTLEITFIQTAFTGTDPDRGF